MPGYELTTLAGVLTSFYANLFNLAIPLCGLRMSVSFPAYFFEFRIPFARYYMKRVLPN